MRLSKEYFSNDDVIFLAQDLLGKYIFTFFDGQLTGGIITETEAYNGIIDKASHAYNGCRTARTEIMYAEGGVIYVYLCYGIHHLLNIVTSGLDIPKAILIRAIKPTHGEELMLKRARKTRISDEITRGPGKVSKALGIRTSDSGLSLESGSVWIEDRKLQISPESVSKGPRIGVDYAGEDALLPYRFRIFP